MTRYQLHILRCIVQFHRVHIKRRIGTGPPSAIIEATRQLPFDWWIIAPYPYIHYNYLDSPDNVRVMTPTQCASLLFSDVMAPRGLVLDGISQHCRLGRDVIYDSINFVCNVYDKSESKIVTINDRGFIVRPT